MKRIIIIGGGTFSPIRNHLSLCAPAFGTTAKQLFGMFTGKSESYNGAMGTYSNGDVEYHVELCLTKMADPYSDLITNDHIDNLISDIIDDESVKTIIMNVAMCDFDAEIDDRGFHGKRLSTSDGEFTLKLKPSEKIISKIRKARPDIFLVGFKTTTGATKEEQFLTALKMMKSSKCNLVLANDTVTRHNMIITPEEVRYEVSWQAEKEYRTDTLSMLVDMIKSRHDLTYTKTNMVEDSAVPFSSAPDTFRKVILHVIASGGFIENNGNGFTPGHFGYKLSDNVFVSSQRKVNHNDVEKNGMTLVKVGDKSITAIGPVKPSVGARSQALLLEKYPEYDCILHVHCPLIGDGDDWLFGFTPKYEIPHVSQKPFQCGSLECGLNTANNMKEILVKDSETLPDLKVMAVMLDRHGPNFMFKSSDNPDDIIEFINSVVLLGTKIQ